MLRHFKKLFLLSSRNKSDLSQHLLVGLLNHLPKFKPNTEMLVLGDRKFIQFGQRDTKVRSLKSTFLKKQKQGVFLGLESREGVLSGKCERKSISSATDNTLCNQTSGHQHLVTTFIPFVRQTRKFSL